MTTANTTLSIMLGRTAFEVRPLTIGQLERVAELTDQFSAAFAVSGTSARAGIASARKVIAIALERIDAEAARDDCGTLEATVPQLFAASRAILVLSGLVAEGGVTGEAPAGVTSD